MLHELEDFDGALAVGGNDDRRVLPPADGRYELVGVIFATFPLKKTPDAVELEAGYGKIKC